MSPCAVSALGAVILCPALWSFILCIWELSVENKGISCRFLQLTPSSPALCPQSPASSSSVFSAQCNPCAALVFPLPALKSPFRQKIWGTIGLSLVVSLLQTSEGYAASCQISENSVSYILTIFSWWQRKVTPILVILSWLKSLYTSTHTYYTSCH